MIIFEGKINFQLYANAKTNPRTTRNVQCFLAKLLVNAFITITEIVGGLLVLLPKTRAVGALVMLPIIIGILAHHFTMILPELFQDWFYGNFTLDFVGKQKKYSQLMN